MFGDGNQSRSFTYVGDVVGALLKLMDEPKAIGQVINIGNPQEVTIRELAERIKRATGSRVAHRDRSCTTRPTTRASRTCRGACPTSTRSTR